jgi:hypothetical protein
MKASTETTERRSSERMAIEREVHCRILNKKDGDTEAMGKTVNISSSGVLFTTDQKLVPGKRLELDISWPAQLDNRCALKLVARGRVIRYDGDRVGFEILQHEFRTKSSRGTNV